MKSRPPIYTRYYDLLGWILDRTAKFPKNMRFGLVQKIEQLVKPSMTGAVSAGMPPCSTDLVKNETATREGSAMQYESTIAARRHRGRLCSPRGSVQFAVSSVQRREPQSKSTPLCTGTWVTCPRRLTSLPCLTRADARNRSRPGNLPGCPGSVHRAGLIARPTREDATQMRRFMTEQCNAGCARNPEVRDQRSEVSKETSLLLRSDL